jgi:hypothetical protein
MTRRRTCDAYRPDCAAQTATWHAPSVEAGIPDATIRLPLGPDASTELVGTLGNWTAGESDAVPRWTALSSPLAETDKITEQLALTDSQTNETRPGHARRHLLSFAVGAGSWCSGLTCQPVTLEIAGSNPVEPATRAYPSPVPARTGLFLFGRTAAWFVLQAAAGFWLMASRTTLSGDLAPECQSDREDRPSMSPIHAQQRCYRVDRQDPQGASDG